MKRFLIAIFLVLALAATPALADIYSINALTTKAITASSNSSSDSYDLKRYRIDGYFSVQVTIAGSGTAKVEYLLSNDGTNFVEPSSASDITSGMTATSGPGSDGIDLFSFSPEPARYLKIKVTETGGANPITATVVLMMN